MLPPGTIVDEKYEISSTLGAGGFGAVYEAVQVQFGRPVALKLLGEVTDAEDLARFELEARAAGALKHKNIVTIYGYGSWRAAPYMVMELVRGKSLQSILAKEQKLEPRRAIALMKQVFEGLSAAHKHGVVHRDLKPSNVMIIQESHGEAVRIIDFGLAKLMPEYGMSVQKITQMGCAVGTAHYMPPEQAQGLPVDQRADIYTAGCIAYQALTGKVPFEGEDALTVMVMHMRDRPEAVSKLILEDGTLGQSLDVFFEKCLAKRVEDRYQDAEEAVADLQALLAGSTDKLKRVSSAPFKAIGTPSGVAKGTVVVLSLIVVALAGISIWQYFRVTQLEQQQVKDQARSDILFEKWRAVHRPEVFHSEEAAALANVLEAHKKDGRLTPQQLYVAYRAGIRARNRLTAEMLYGDSGYNRLIALIDPAVEEAIALRKSPAVYYLDDPESEFNLIHGLAGLGKGGWDADILRSILLSEKVHQDPKGQLAVERAWNVLRFMDLNRHDYQQAEATGKFVLAHAAEANIKAEALCYLGDLYCFQRRFAESKAMYQQSAKYPEPECQLWALLGFARIAVGEQDYKRALKFIDQVEDKAPPIYNAQLLKAACLAALQGRTAAQRVVAENDDQPFLRTPKWDMRREDLDRTQDIFRKAGAESAWKWFDDHRPRD
jgi:predicted Ser/Thr protein kinase